MLTTESEGPYQWLVTDKQFDLLELCAEVALGKFVAVTSFDSGVFQPTEAETAAGWRSSGRIAYSPQILKMEELPRAGWDEWYIFESPTDLGISHLAENIFEVPQEQGHVSVFVNYRLALHGPEMKHFATLFWQQMARIRPESYVADNDYLNFVSRNTALFARVCDVIKAIG